jgi:hypothetical protein
MSKPTIPNTTSDNDMSDAIGRDVDSDDDSDFPEVNVAIKAAGGGRNVGDHAVRYNINTGHLGVSDEESKDDVNAAEIIPDLNSEKTLQSIATVSNKTSVTNQLNIGEHGEDELSGHNTENKSSNSEVSPNANSSYTRIEKDNDVKARLIKILGKGTAGFGVASSKTISAAILKNGEASDHSYSITSSRSSLGELGFEITNSVAKTKSKLVFKRDGLKAYLEIPDNNYNQQVLDAPEVENEALNNLLTSLEETNAEDIKIKEQVKATESLKKSLEKLSQISRDPATRRKLQNHPANELQAGSTYSYEVTETTDENGVVTYDITRIHKAAPDRDGVAAEITLDDGTDDRRMSRIVFEPGKKTKGFLGLNSVKFGLKIVAILEGTEEGVLDDLVLENADGNGIGKYEETVRFIEQGKSQSKESNTVANDALKTSISGILGRNAVGGVASSKDIVVKDFVVKGRNTNFHYEITSKNTLRGGISFDIKKTLDVGGHESVRYSRLVFEGGKTAVGYVNKKNAGDLKLSPITPDNHSQYDAILRTLRLVNTRDTENKAQLKTAAPLVKSLEGLAKKKPEELRHLQILNDEGFVDIAAGTDTYQATKTVVGNVTTYNVIKTHYNQTGQAEGDRKNYRLILEPGKKARGFLDKTDAEVLNHENVIELTQDDAATGILAFLSEVNPVANGTRKSTLKNQVKATDPLKTSLETLLATYNNEATRHKLQNHKVSEDEIFSYEVTKDVVGEESTYTIKRTNSAVEDDVVVYSKVKFEAGEKTKGFLNQADENSLLSDLIPGNADNVGTDAFLAEITAINQGKSAKKDANKAQNDVLKANLLSLLDGSYSKNIVVRNPDGTEYTYKINKEIFSAGDVFTLVKNEGGVETSSKLEFDSKKTARGYVNRGVGEAKNMEPIFDEVRDGYIDEIALFGAAKLQEQLQDLVKDGESKELTIGGNAVTISRGDDENGKKRRALTALGVVGDSFVNLETELKRNHDGGGAHGTLVEASAALNLIDGESAKKTAFSALNALAGVDLDAKMNGLFNGGGANYENIAAVMATIPPKQELFHIKDTRKTDLTHATLAFDANNPRKVTALTPDALVRGDAGMPADEALIQRIAQMSGRVAEYQSQDKVVVKAQSKVSGKLKDSLQKIYDDHQIDRSCLSNLPALNPDGSIDANGKTDSYVIDVVFPTAANKYTTTYKITKTSKDKDGDLVAVDPKKYSVYAFDSEGAVTGFTDKPAAGAGSVDLADENTVAAAMKPLNVDKAATPWERISRIDLRNTGSIDPVAMGNIQNILNERSTAKSQKSATDPLRESLEKLKAKYDEVPVGGGVAGDKLKRLPILDPATGAVEGSYSYVVAEAGTVEAPIYTITRTKHVEGVADKITNSRYEFDNKGAVKGFKDKPVAGVGAVDLGNADQVAAAMLPITATTGFTQGIAGLKIDSQHQKAIDAISAERSTAKSQKSATDKLRDALDKKYNEYNGGVGLKNLPIQGKDGAIDPSKGTDSYIVKKDDTTALGKTTYTITETHKNSKGGASSAKYSRYEFDNISGEVKFFEGKDSLEHAMTPLALEKPNLLFGRPSIASVLGKSSLNLDSKIISRVDEISEKRTDSPRRQLEETGYAFATGTSKAVTKTAVVVGSIPVVALSVAPLAKPLVKSVGSLLVAGARLIGAGAVGALYDLPVGIYKTIEEGSFSEGFKDSFSPKIIEPSVIALSERKEEFKEASSSFRGAISKVDEIRKSDKPFVETLEALSGVGTVLSEVATDGGQKLSAMFKSPEESNSQVISESQKPKVAGVSDSSSRASDQSENKPIAKKRDIIRSGGKSYEYVGGSWSVVEEENPNKFKSKADRERSESPISITEGAEEGHRRVAKRSERFGVESKAEPSNIVDAKMALSEAVDSGQISSKNAAKAKMAVLAGIVKSVDDLSENKSGKLSFGKKLTKKEEALLDSVTPSASTAVISEKRSVSEVERKRGDNVSLDVNYAEHRDIKFSESSDFSKAFMNRFASSTFEGCDLSSVGKNKMTFRHCTFGEGCTLPDDLSKIGKNSFVNCKFSEKFLDSLGDRRDEFVDKFGLHGGSKDGYLDNSPRSSVKEHEAVNLKQRFAGR